MPAPGANSFNCNVFLRGVCPGATNVLRKDQQKGVVLDEINEGNVLACILTDGPWRPVYFWASPGLWEVCRAGVFRERCSCDGQRSRSQRSLLCTAGARKRRFGAESINHETVIRQAGEQAGVAPTDEEIAEKFNQFKANFPDEVTFQNALAQYGVQEEQLIESCT